MKRDNSLPRVCDVGRKATRYSGVMWSWYPTGTMEKRPDRLSFQKPMRSLSLLLSCTLLMPAFAEDAGDWPSWRGPDKDGMARGAAPMHWSDTEHIKWKAEIPGRGHSSPSSGAIKYS